MVQAAFKEKKNEKKKQSIRFTNQVYCCFIFSVFIIIKFGVFYSGRIKQGDEK